MPDLVSRDEVWFANWLDAVQIGTGTMSQRALTSVESNGGLNAAIEAAKLRSMHLLAFTDGNGHRFVAAIRHAFKSFC